MQNILERCHNKILPWHYYREEKYRLSSFCTYPSSCTKCAAQLAADGFVYTGSGRGSDDSVTCYFCGVSTCGWNFLDVVPDVHAALSPGCSMVTGVDCRNVTFITCSLSARNLLSAAAGVSLQDVTTESRDITPSLETTETVVTSHPVTIQDHNGVSITNSIQSNRVVPSTQATINSSGWGLHTTFSTVSSNNTSTTLSSTLISDTEFSTHSTITPSSQSSITTPVLTDPYNTQNSATEEVVQTGTPVSITPHNQAPGDTPGNCAPTRRNKTGGAAPTFKDLAIITERPKRIEYALKIKRLQTFENWPRGHHLTADELASAGFYYAGRLIIFSVTCQMSFYQEAKVVDL